MLQSPRLFNSKILFKNHTTLQYPNPTLIIVLKNQQLQHTNIYFSKISHLYLSSSISHYYLTATNESKTRTLFKNLSVHIYISFNQ